MPGSTPRGYPYPSGADQALGSRDIQSLAEAIDADVEGTVSRSGGTMTGPLTLSGNPAASADAGTK